MLSIERERERESEGEGRSSSLTRRIVVGWKVWRTGKTKSVQSFQISCNYGTRGMMGDGGGC